MVVSLDIVPASRSLYMYGEPDPSSAYSLSGHVSVSVSSPYSIFHHLRTTRIQLHSIVLTFEGQTEILTPHTGYSSARLCSITREIAPPDPVELSNQGHEDSNEPCVWNVVFNLSIPGWLPESSLYSVDDLGTRYTLFAEARFTYIEDTQSDSWSFATLCSPFRHRIKSVDAKQSIILRRLVSPSKDSLDPSASTLTYLVGSLLSGCADGDEPRIPTEVLSKIQVLASVPDYVDVNSGEFPVTIHMRAQDLEVDKCQRMKITSIAVDIIQWEKCRTRPSSDYVNRHPLPPSSQQPPNLPLRDAHPFSSIYDFGLYEYHDDKETASRSFSLLPPGQSGPHSLSRETFPFANDTPGSSTWYTMETTVPFRCHGLKHKSDEWAGSPVLRPSTSSPLINVRHEVSIQLMCQYNLLGSDLVAREQLSFFLPVRFAHFVANPPDRYLTSLPVDHEMSSCGPSLPIPSLYTPNLPAYSQLFYPNGNRKIDYSIPLPLYTPRSPSSLSTCDLGVEMKEMAGPFLSAEILS